MAVIVSYHSIVSSCIPYIREKVFLFFLFLFFVFFLIMAEIVVYYIRCLVMGKAYSIVSEYRISKGMEMDIDELVEETAKSYLGVNEVSMSEDSILYKKKDSWRKMTREQIDDMVFKAFAVLEGEHVSR